MEINKSTPLPALAEYMGADATYEDAQAMLAVLLDAGVINTLDVSAFEWDRFLDKAVNGWSE
jgi:hypothetical protein